MMNTRQIMQEWLQGHGFDGLCNPDLECGCPVHDLMPCEANPGHAVVQDDGDIIITPGTGKHEEPII